LRSLVKPKEKKIKLISERRAHHAQLIYTDKNVRGTHPTLAIQKEFAGASLQPAILRFI
jgi:hypothetical protein